MTTPSTEPREGTDFEGFMRNADSSVICVQCAEGRHSECPQLPDLPSGDPGNAPLEGYCCECGCDYQDTGPARDAKALDAIAQLMSDDEDWNADTTSAIHHIVIGTGRKIRTLVDDDEDGE